MAILTKNALSASNQASFPNNTTGAITPQILRNFNQDVIDTLVDSLNTGSYAITTGSNDFTQPNNFTSISASSFVSASQFVGDGSKLTNITASVAIPISDEGILQGYATQLNFSGSNISASLQAGIATISVNTNNLVTTSSFNSYTSSNDSKVNSLISATASYANSASVAAVDAAQQSQINSIIASTSSFALTSLNAFTASQETKDATLGLYTASVDQKFTNIGGQSGSWDNTSLNAFTASQNTKNSTLATYTASVDTKFSNIGSQSASWDNTNLNSFTSSQNTKNSTLATYTASVDTKFATLGTQSGSWITDSETGSFARTNVNNIFTGVQTFQSISASGDIKGLYFQGDVYTYTIKDGIGTIAGVVAVSSSLSVTNAFSASLQQGYVWVGDSNNRTTLVATSSFAGTPTNITSLNAFTASQDTKNATLANVTASLQQQLTNIGGQSGSWITESETASFARTNVDNNFSVNQTFTNITAVSASFQYVKTTYETSSVIYSSGSNQFGDELSDIQTLSGSVKVQGTLTINGLPVATGSTDISSLNAFTASQETKNSTLATYTASVDSSLTNINSFTASNGNTSLNSYTASNDTKWSNLAGQTGSYVTSAITASSLVTASAAGNTITFTKGDASTFNVSVVAAAIDTGSFATTASFNAYTSSNNQRVSSLETNSASVNISISNINTATASLFTSTSLSLITASFDTGTRNLTFTKGNTNQFSVNIPDTSGSAGTTVIEVVYTGESITKGDPLYISGSQGANPIVFKADASNPAKMPVTFISNETIGAANTTNAIVLGLIEGIDLTGYVAGQTIYVAEGGGYSINLPSGSNSITQLLGVITKGGSGGKGLVLNPGPAQLPGLDNGYMWVGNSSNQPIEITTASFASSASFNSYTSSTNSRLTNIEATTASLNTSVAALNTFTASQDTKNTTLGNLTGSFATTGSNSFNGIQSISGSFNLTGSAFGNVVSMSVSSNTASMNFNLGNYFELTASVSPIRIEVSNLKGGVTSTLALNGVTASTINFSSNVLQPSGSAYTASVSGSNDILSFVAFNSNRVNVVSTLKMI
jgi:hypothetical protein